MMWLLFNDQPRHVVQLGLGSAALTKFCYRRLPGARVTAIELNPNVIATCGALFGLPPNDERLNVVEMNALDFVLDPANRSSADARVLPGLLRHPGRGRHHDPNVFGDFSNYDKNLQAMEQVFDAVVWLPEVHDANIVVIAFKRSPALDFSVLYERAGAIKTRLNLPAKSWVNGLKGWMLDQQ